MSKQLLSIQKILNQLGVDGYYRPTGPDRHLAQLSIEILTGENESNHLEICEIPIPDSELFLLQWFVQLPLSEPFAPNDPIPCFQQTEVLAFCAVAPAYDLSLSSEDFFTTFILLLQN